MTRQELIKLQRTATAFPQSLLQYLGTFSRENNRPAPDWPLKNGNRLSERFDMTNLQIVIPGFRIPPGITVWVTPGAYRRKPNSAGYLAWTGWTEPITRLIASLIPTITVIGDMGPGIHDINALPATDPDFFQIINYATNEAVGVYDPNRPNTFQIGAALIDLYDGDDLMIRTPTFQAALPTLLRSSTWPRPRSYVYGIESMSYEDPNFNGSHRALGLLLFTPSPCPPHFAATTRFSTGGLRMSANLVTPITPF